MILLRSLVLAAVCCVNIALAAAEESPFKAAAAEVDITPRLGTPMSGYYKLRECRGVIDPLLAKAIVIEQDGQKAAFVVIDLSSTTRSIVDESRKLIAEQTGIPPERVMISATHTHTGPTLTRNSFMDSIVGATSAQTVDYEGLLPSLIAKAVKQANDRLAPARSMAAIGREEQLSYNRRFELEDGTFAWQARLDPKLKRALGPIDPDVGVWRLEADKKSNDTLATYVNFAMHPTSIGGGLELSPDYPGYLAKRMTEYLGPGAITVFANGCCGNINHQRPHWNRQTSGVRESERLGTMLAAAVFRAWPELKPLETFAPRARSTVVTLPRKKFTADEVADARKVFDTREEKNPGTVPLAKAVCTLDCAEKADEPLDAEVQVIAVGPELAIVAMPGEIFVELGLDIKRRSPFKYTYIAELANGSIGYVPHHEAYPQGLYEVLSARGEAGSGEILVEAAVKMLNEIAKAP